MAINEIRSFGKHLKEYWGMYVSTVLATTVAVILTAEIMTLIHPDTDDLFGFDH